MRGFQFQGDNFNEVVNFCTKRKLKNLIGFEFNNQERSMFINTTNNKYKITDGDFIFWKYNNLSYYKTAIAFKEAWELGGTNQKMISIE
jgi:hypothetical protein